MLAPKELLNQGRLEDAINSLTGEVKANPSDIRRRVFLFELLCFASRFDKAEKQLTVIGHLDSDSAGGVQMLQNLLKAEQEREKVFNGADEPHFLFDPPDYIETYLGAVKLARDGHTQQARQAIDKADEQRPTINFKCGDEALSEFHDTNDLTAPVLEVFINGAYVWLPFEFIKHFAVNQPTKLRDLIWTTAQIDTSVAMSGEVFIPALYAGSSRHPDDAVKLGRKTEWRDIGDGIFKAAGLRLFSSTSNEKSIFELQHMSRCISEQKMEAVSQR